MPVTIRTLPASVAWLRIEFLTIYLVAPLSMAALVAAGVMGARFTPLGFLILFVAALALLARTPGFDWRSLIVGRLAAHWPVALGFAAVCALTAVALTRWLAPQALFFLPLEAPGVWAAMSVLYPALSVVPQGLIYRALFFQRYRSLFPDPRIAIPVNALLFGLAHLFYLNWVAVTLTALGGLVFAWAYVVARSFPLSVLLHAIAGWLVFTSGLGVVYFLHTAITP